jgi:metal-responsive CopG/Arc/MetJ family transcriptional regulator
MMTQTLKKEPKFMLGVTVEHELVQKLDIIRGLVPRSRIVEEVLTDFIKQMEEKGNGKLIQYTSIKRE